MSIPGKDIAHMPLCNGKPMWYSFLKPSSFINTGEHGKRKLTLLSEARSLLRKKKFFYFENLAPGTIKENIIGCYLQIGILAGEKVELCYKKDRKIDSPPPFYFNTAGIVHIMTFPLFKSRDFTGARQQTRAL